MSDNNNVAKNFWAKLDPKSKKKLAYLTAVSIIVIIALGGYFISHHNLKPQKVSNTNNKTMNITLQPGVLQENMNNKVNNKLSNFQKQLQILQKNVEEVKKEQAAANNSTNSTNKLGFPSKPTHMINNYPSSYNVPPPPPLNGYPEGLSSNGENPNNLKAQPQAEIIGSIGVASNSNASKEIASSVKKKKPTDEVFLPPSFMQASLLSGLDAPTMAGAHSNPVPVLLRVRAPAILPNSVRANLRGCFIIAEGVGNLASQRVMLRLVSLSCIAKDGHAVIDQNVKGFVVDSDGKIGLRGRVVAKMGAMLARAALAGFLTGFGNAINTSSYTSYTSSMGTTSSLNGGEVARSALGGGTSAAAKKLADFYMKLADQTLPVIEIGATRRVTVVISKGEMLKIMNVCVGGQECSEKD